MPDTPMTDTTKLPVPEWLKVPDRDAVAAQHVYVSASWWQSRLDERRLPGSPLRLQRDEAGEFLTRADVWDAAASGGGTDAEVLSLLWHALAWGAGRKAVRNEERRMDAVAADPARAADLLRQAAAAAVTAPERAYETLHAKPKGALKQLGPAFGTKFLYFAGRGAAEHPSLILDKRVATALTHAGWASLVPEGGWPVMTYGRYCALARRWAKELSEEAAPVAPDQIEYALFSSKQSRQPGGS